MIVDICAAEDCDRLASGARGFCPGHYEQFRRHGAAGLNRRAKACKACGGSMRGLHASSVYCSPQCSLEEGIKHKAATQRLYGIDHVWKSVLRGDPCAYCDAPSATLDHVLARFVGGGDGAENLVGACFSCNARKGTSSLLTFLLRR